MIDSKTLYIVATPIGNLGDISDRAKQVLNSVDIVYCEDTRVGKKLLTALGLSNTCKTFHQHSTESDMQVIADALLNGGSIAYISDAGTPGISDPGNKLVSFLSDIDGIAISPIPGPSAVIAALSICGFATDSFTFMGFPPHKNKRKKYFETVANENRTVVFFESPHRIEKAIQQMVEILDNEREICVCRELTKKFESIYRGSVQDIASASIPSKGEFVIVVNKPYI